ncbi:MAG TPA: anaerobic ribonucleoside-triphosphate reductase activating protein [Acholeplasma sp.]|nr:anaerobic ribonucleoside-triphosphate reductase activating protein [Acholeplasma sp.]
MNVLNTTELKLRINNIIDESIVDGEGIRMVVFTQGCKLRCAFCHNPATHELEAGEFVDLEFIRNKWKLNPLLSGITISGGEPFLQVEAVYELVKLAKKDNLDVIVYSGYTYESLKARNCEYTNGILETADLLIDGPFIHQLKDLSLMWRGSSNQRVIDLKETKMKDEVVTRY